jgi:hypothetical protein
MAVEVQQVFEGVTLGHYDQLLAEAGYRPKGPGAPGCIFHHAVKTDSGFRVVDVWESQEAFDKFAQERLGPLAQEFGLAPPSVSIAEVHNYLTAAD